VRENNVKKIVAAGGKVVNGWLGIPSSVSAEFMAHQGWDSLCIDMQHGLIDYQDSVGMLQAISTTSVTPLVRVPWNEPDMIMKALDAGAYGIICPMINTREECEAFVGACRYAPVGYRSWGPTRGIIYGGADYAKESNATMLAIAMIETQEGLDNVDAIMSVKGLDGVYVGPSDLGISLGFPPGFDPVEPKLLAAFDTIADAAKRHKVIAGIHCGSSAYALKMIERGYNFVTILGDIRLMAWAAKNAVTAVKSGKASPNAP
jgi:4-hydroxy-2-oxoheptanedioate aldolase